MMQNSETYAVILKLLSKQLQSLKSFFGSDLSNIDFSMSSKIRPGLFINSLGQSYRSPVHAPIQEDEHQEIFDKMVNELTSQQSTLLLSSSCKAENEEWEVPPLGLGSGSGLELKSLGLWVRG
jgi:hypothetical protein